MKKTLFAAVAAFSLTSGTAFANAWSGTDPSLVGCPQTLSLGNQAQVIGQSGATNSDAPSAFGKQCSPLEEGQQPPLGRVFVH